MNPIHWLFARIYQYIHTLLPDAKVEMLPEATLIVLDVFLLYPLVQAIFLAEAALDTDIGKVGVVVVWVLMTFLNRHLLLGDKTVARILSRYPVKPASKAQAQTFFGALVLLALLSSFFPIVHMLR